MDIKKVCVIGAGVMGSGIAQVCAQSGYETNVIDISDDILKRGLENIKKVYLSLLRKERSQKR